MKFTLIIAALASCMCAVSFAEDFLVFEGKGDGPGKGKHIVLLSGDDEYRSEEALPQLGKILAEHHGFKCTVTFSLNADGTINPEEKVNVPGLEALKTADLMIIAYRFRNPKPEMMQHIVDYLDAGKPVLGMRTATHAFDIKGDSPFKKYSHSFGGADFKQGFGKQILGETWVNHHGGHGSESTRGIIAPGAETHPILRGIKDGDIWGPTDVYTVNLPLPGDSKPLVLGQVVKGMKFDDPPLEGKKNDPMMPVAWTKTYGDKHGRVFTTTMGAATDLVTEGTRRMLVNAAYWCLGLEDKISEKSNVEIVGKFEPTKFGFGSYVKGKKPEDYK